MMGRSLIRVIRYVNGNRGLCLWPIVVVNILQLPLELYHKTNNNMLINMLQVFCSCQKQTVKVFPTLVNHGAFLPYNFYIVLYSMIIFKGLNG